MKKQCIICGIEKPLIDFYKHKKMGDGHLNKCKECCKSQSKEREEKLRLDPKWLEKEHERHREKYHRLDYREKHKPTYEMKKEAMDRYRNKYPEKVEAKIKSQRIKPLIKGNELHHWSYNETHYKDVIELSNKDHNIIHRFMYYDQERKMYREANTDILLDTKEVSLEFYKKLGVLPIK